MLVRGRLLEDSIRSDADYTDYFFRGRPRVQVPENLKFRKLYTLTAHSISLWVPEDPKERWPVRSEAQYLVLYICTVGRQNFRHQGSPVQVAYLAAFSLLRSGLT